MIAIDSNILVYAHRQDSAWHAVARRCVTGLAEGTSQWMIPWPVVHEFLAIVTHPRIYSPATSLQAAISQVDCWLASPTAMVGGETLTHWQTLCGQLLDAKIAGPQVHDARIVAICLDFGVHEFWSADRDFSRFPDLKVVNPLR